MALISKAQLTGETPKIPEIPMLPRLTMDYLPEPARSWAIRVLPPEIDSIVDPEVHAIADPVMEDTPHPRLPLEDRVEALESNVLPAIAERELRLTQLQAENERLKLFLGIICCSLSNAADPANPNEVGFLRHISDKAMKRAKDVITVGFDRDASIRCWELCVVTDTAEDWNSFQRVPTAAGEDHRKPYRPEPGMDLANWSLWMIR